MSVYSKWFIESLNSIIKDALKHLEKGTNDNPIIYITFHSNHPDVSMPLELKKAYPEIMTIALENKFSNLRVTQSHVMVTLYFANEPSDFTIPISSIIQFHDRDLNIHIVKPVENKANIINFNDIKKK